MTGIKHILLVGPYPRSPANIRGGVEASVFGLAQALTVNSRVTVLAVRGGEPTSSAQEHDGDDQEPVRVLRLPRRSRGAYEALGVPRVLASLQRDWPSVIHVHGTGVVQLLLILASRLGGSRTVWTLHGITAIETKSVFKKNRSLGNLGRWMLYALLESLQAALAPKIIVDTNYVRSALGDRLRKKIFVIPQGIIQVSNRELARPSPDPLVLSVGVLTPRKGHHLLIDSFAPVLVNVPNAKLVICGATRDRKYIERLGAQIDALGISESVVVEVGPPAGVISDYLQRSWLFALHSEEESQGIAICEAMNAGLPVVATRVGGIPDVVRDGVDGLLSEYGDTSRFSESILRIIADQSLRDRMSKASATRSLDYEWSNLAEQVNDLYFELPEGRRT